MGQRGPRHPEGRIDVGLHRGVEILGRQVLQLFAELLATGIVDQDVQPAQLGHGALDHLLAEALVAQVARNGDGHAALRLDQRHDRVGIGLFVGQIADGDVRTLAGKGDGCCGADAAVAAGDQGALAQQAACAAIAGLAMVGQGVHLLGQAGKGLFLRREIGDGKARLGDGATAERGTGGGVGHLWPHAFAVRRPTAQHGECSGPSGARKINRA